MYPSPFNLILQKQMPQNLFDEMIDEILPKYLALKYSQYKENYQIVDKVLIFYKEYFVNKKFHFTVTDNWQDHNCLPCIFGMIRRFFTGLIENKIDARINWITAGLLTHN